MYVDVVGDLFHYGHVEFFRRARDLGDALVVGVHSDATAESYKRVPVMTMDSRTGGGTGLASELSCAAVGHTASDNATDT